MTKRGMGDVANYRPSIPRLIGASLGAAALPILAAPRLSWGALAASGLVWATFVAFGWWFFTVRVTRDTVVGAGGTIRQGRKIINIADLGIDSGRDSELGDITIASKRSGNTISVSLLSKNVRMRLVRSLESSLESGELD